MIFRGPGFLAVVSFGLHANPLHVDSLSRFSCWSPVELNDGKGRGGGGRGAESYDREEAWPSGNRSSFSAPPRLKSWLIFK